MSSRPTKFYMNMGNPLPVHYLNIKEYAHENKYGTSNQIGLNRVRCLIVSEKTKVERL
jgi:hypothetical protein